MLNITKEIDRLIKTHTKIEDLLDRFTDYLSDTTDKISEHDTIQANQLQKVLNKAIELETIFSEISGDIYSIFPNYGY